MSHLGALVEVLRTGNAEAKEAVAAIALLVELVRSGSEGAKEQAAGALQNLATNAGDADDIFNSMTLAEQESWKVGWKGKVEATINILKTMNPGEEVTLPEVEDARAVAAIGTLMAVWWTTEAIPLAATSLLPIVLMPMVTDLDVAGSTAPYASPIVFLFLGGFLIAIAMEKWNLHRRIALWTLRRVGTSPKQIVLGLMLATGFLSMWVSNTATTLMMLPIGLSVIALMGDRANTASDAADNTAALPRPGHVDLGEDSDIRRFAICLMLAIAWSASMGGLGTLLGSPPNAIIAGYASTELGIEIGFLDWMMLGVPTALAFILSAGC